MTQNMLKGKLELLASLAKPMSTLQSDISDILGKTGDSKLVSVLSRI